MISFNALRSAAVEISIADPRYPAAWKALSDPPERLYAVGDISLLQGKLFAVVGSRRTPLNALKLGGEIAKGLSRDFVLVTGTSDGGDEATVEGALAGSGRVVCLLAGGLGSIPQAFFGKIERVLARGLLLAVHPFDAPVRTFSYEYRNKLLAAFTEGTLVLGAGEKSGALITARYATKYRKPIFALPYPPNSASGCGCNALIKKGGYLTENEGDIRAYYGLQVEEEREEIPLTADEEKLYRALKDKIEAHVSELASLSALPPFKLRGLLSALEIKGLVVSLGGNRYTILK